MQQIFKDFHLARKTRAGVLVLLVILFLLILIWRLLPFLAKPKVSNDELALQAAWSKFRTEHVVESPENSGLSYDNTPQQHSEENKGELFPFNPNTASEADLLRLGLPKYTVNTILKFRGKSPMAFKKKEDLQKLYTLKPEDYERIAPYVRIPGNSDVVSTEYSNVHSENTNPVVAPKSGGNVELNNASGDQLMSLRGIGPGYSNRIIKFRDLLGGFYQVEQLKEVYGFPDSTFQQLKNKFTINSSLIKRINLNIADEKTLAHHPYIGWKLASGIVKYRNDIGQFNDLEQLRQVPLINEEKYRKIAPYLSTH